MRWDHIYRLLLFCCISSEKRKGRGHSSGNSHFLNFRIRTHKFYSSVNYFNYSSLLIHSRVSSPTLWEFSHTSRLFHSINFSFMCSGLYRKRILIQCVLIHEKRKERDMIYIWWLHMNSSRSTHKLCCFTTDVLFSIVCIIY